MSVSFEEMLALGVVSEDELTWKPDFPTFFAQGALAAGLYYGSSALVSLGGGWILVGIILGGLGVVSTVIALSGLFAFD